MSKTHNIWTTTEVMAWASDLDHQDYLALHKKNGDKYIPFSSEEYDTLCDVFETHMLRSHSFSEEEQHGKF